MSTLLVVLDSLPTAQDVDALKKAVGRSAEVWTRLVTAPSVARVVAQTSSADEAAQILLRLQGEGIGSRIIEVHHVDGATNAAFEATFVEQLRDGLVAIKANGEDMEVNGRAIRSMTTGVQIVDGQRQHFVVLGLSDSPGAIVLRFPGSASKLLRAQFGEASHKNEELHARSVVEVVARIAPHARKEHMDPAAVPPPVLGALGSRDLPRAAVVAAWLERNVPTSANSSVMAPVRSALTASSNDVGHEVREFPFHGAEPPLPPPPEFRARTPETEEERLARMRDVAESMLALDRKVAEARVGARSDHVGNGLVNSFGTRPSPDRRQLVAIAVGVVVLGIAAVLAFRSSPALSNRRLKLGDGWRTPYGATIRYVSNYDASVGGIGNLGFAFVIENAATREQVRVPAHEAARWRDTLGLRWRIEEHEASGRWVTLQAQHAP